MTYKLAYGKTAVELSGNVTHWLRKGFQLYGDPFTMEGYFFQAMVKYS